MVVLMLLGFAAYFQLGQDEDPPFHLPGDGGVHLLAWRHSATGGRAGGDRQDRAHAAGSALRRTKIRSYPSQAGRRSSSRSRIMRARTQVANIWYTVHKKVGDMRYTLPPACRGRSSTMSSAMCWRDLRAGVRRLQLRRAEDLADDVRQQLLRVRDVAKIEQFGVQDEKLFVEISQSAFGAAGAGFQPGAGPAGQPAKRSGIGRGCADPLDQVQVRVGGQFNAI